MKMLTRIAFVILLAGSCAGKTSKDPLPDTRSSFEKKLDNMSQAEFDTAYAQICRRLGSKRIALGKKWAKAADESARKAILDESRKLLLSYLADSIFVCWYGTGWDFNGTSSSPRQGNVACGYFVTSVLKQSGFDIRRTWLAQQASSVMIDTLCAKAQVRIFTNGKTQKLFDYIANQPDGIFLLGLDNHTGFIVKRNGENRFVHSSYLSRFDRVLSEPLEKSEIILKNRYFVTGNLSQSDETMRRWIRGEKIGN